MLIKTGNSGFLHTVASEITSQAAYNNRRDLMKLMATGVAGAAMASWASREAFAQAAIPRPGKLAALAGAKSALAGAVTMEKVTDYKDASTYNNFYEFGTDKADPAQHAHTLKTKPWTVEIEGMVKKPVKYTLEDLIKLSAQEERVYRMRCVEGWSMVIPWLGLPLASLIKWAEPTGNAKYIEFISAADPQMMPGVRAPILDWPYTEGLRMDEATNPLTLLAVGLYGEVLPNQNGAPVRLVTPWKYGFKGGKSIVKIRFVEKIPLTTWVKSGPNEYGFYANVNPEVDHPRWSQSSEKPIGAGLFGGRIKTKMFNGYTEQVGQMYAGMDLFNNF